MDSLSIQHKKQLDDNSNNQKYFTSGGTKILIAEHFSEKGMSLSEILEEIILQKIRKENIV